MVIHQEIYTKKSRAYWEDLDAKVRDYAQKEGLEYVVDDDTMHKPFEARPTIVNFFYHSEIKKSAKGKK